MMEAIRFSDCICGPTLHAGFHSSFKTWFCCAYCIQLLNSCTIFIICTMYEWDVRKISKLFQKFFWINNSNITIPLVEASHDLTLIFSPDGRITYASPSAKNAMGVEPNELRGQTTKDVVHPDDIPLFRAVGEKTLSKLGEVVLLSHVCMRGSKTNNYVSFCCIKRVEVQLGY